MRPAILQWKVCLALFAVVLVAATLGGVLHSSPKPDTTTITLELKAVRVPVSRRGPAIILPLRSTAQPYFVKEKPSPSPLDRLRAWLEATFRK